MTQNLQKLRQQFLKCDIDAFIVPRGDEYLGEFVPPCAERLAWVSGFTGSAGIAIIQEQDAVIFTDGRYDIQVREQVSQEDYEIQDITRTPPETWVYENIPAATRLGYDPGLHTAEFIKRLDKQCRKADIILKPVIRNPIDMAWQDQPALPETDIVKFPDKTAGVNSFQKRQKIAHDLKEKGLYGVFLALPESVCWLLNVRAQDIDHTPVALSRGFLYADDGRFEWYIDPSRISEDINEHIGDLVTTIAPDRLQERLETIGHEAKAAQKNILLDEKRAPVYFKNILKETGASLKSGEDPCLIPRAVKSRAEQDAMRATHIQDGVAICNFLKWLDDIPADGEITELSAANKLADFRSAHPDFKDTSFETISGFGPNGAIVHYRVSPETASPLNGDGLYLVDSGGQYFGSGATGTTDITRTVPIGDISKEQKRHYTCVLRGHIRLAQAAFPQGTTGAQIDALAREPLWEASLDYAHGTGHGVGCYLCVHEESATLSPKGERPLQAGMILSNEPGYYKKGSHGIRLENLVLVVDRGETLNDGRRLLGFETLSLAPFDRRLILTHLLTVDEKNWIDSYHQLVRDSIGPLADDNLNNWLSEMCAPLEDI